MSEEPVKNRRGHLFPKTLSSIIEPMTRPVLRKHYGPMGTRLVSEWVTIVGANLAAHVTPLKVVFPRGSQENATLKLRVTAGFTTEVTYQQGLLIEKINQHLGYKAIAKIEVVSGYH